VVGPGGARGVRGALRYGSGNVVVGTELARWTFACGESASARFLPPTPDSPIHYGARFPLARVQHLLDVLPLPVLFAGLCLAWPVLTGMPAPWWALAGLALYSGLAGTALVVALQGKE
jgi:hypothetical protein